MQSIMQSINHAIKQSKDLLKKPILPHHAYSYPQELYTKNKIYVGAKLLNSQHLLARTVRHVIEDCN